MGDISEIKQNLNEISRIIVETVPVESIYLFGSHAYGVPNDDSDLDLYIVFKDEISAASDPIAKREEKVAEYEQQFNNPFRAAEMGYVDDIIEPAESRQRIISAFDMLASKRESLPQKKHGNIPL